MRRRPPVSRTALRCRFLGKLLGHIQRRGDIFSAFERDEPRYIWGQVAPAICSHDTFTSFPWWYYIFTGLRVRWESYKTFKIAQWMRLYAPQWRGVGESFNYYHIRLCTMILELCLSLHRSIRDKSIDSASPMIAYLITTHHLRKVMKRTLLKTRLMLHTQGLMMTSIIYLVTSHFLMQWNYFVIIRLIPGAPLLPGYHRRQAAT